MDKIKIMTILLMIIMMILAFACGGKKEKIVKTEDDNCDEVSTRSVQGSELEVKASGTFKSFMDACSITDQTSDAYKTVHKMIPDENGVYSAGPYKAVAMASYYGKVGDKFKITLDSGKAFMAIMTDTKQEKHIGPDYADLVNGSVIEFVVNTDLLANEAFITGSMDYIYPGKILNIEKI